MAIQTLTQIYYLGSSINKERAFRGGPETDLYVEASAQTYLAGDLIFMNGASNVAVCAVNGSSQSNGQIGGQAGLSATGVAGTNVRFPIIRPDEEFQANVYHATPASAITAKTQIGSAFALVRIAGNWYVDIQNAVEGSANALARVIVTDIPKRAFGAVNAVGDQYGFVVCQFLPLSLALTGTNAGQRLLQFSI